MSTNPAGWHPDPLGRHQHRYWDGTNWTDHVSDGGTSSIDPHGTAPTPAAAAASFPPPVQAEPEKPRRTYVDATLNSGFTGTKRLFVDEDAIWWGKDALPFAGATAYAHWRTRIEAGPSWNMQYRIKVCHGKKDETILLGGRDDVVRQCYDATCEVLFRHVGVRLIEETVAKVRAGESVEVGGWVVDSAGATRRKKSFTWGTPIRFEVQSGQFASVNVFRTDGEKDVRVGDFSPQMDNGPIIQSLFATMEKVFA